MVSEQCDGAYRVAPRDVADEVSMASPSERGSRWHSREAGTPDNLTRRDASVRLPRLCRNGTCVTLASRFGAAGWARHACDLSSIARKGDEGVDPGAARSSSHQRRHKAMRFMMLMIPKGYESAAPGAMPTPEQVAAMSRYNETMQKAGILLTVDGLHPPSTGARVSFEGGKPKVTDGPFAEAKEVVGGYWMIQVKSRDEAIEWAKRCPASENETIEIRQVQEMSDFPPEILPPKLGAREQGLRDELERKSKKR